MFVGLSFSPPQFSLKDFGNFRWLEWNFISKITKAREIFNISVAKRAVWMNTRLYALLMKYYIATRYSYYKNLLHKVYSTRVSSVMGFRGGRGVCIYFAMNRIMYWRKRLCNACLFQGVSHQNIEASGSYLEGR